MKKSAPIIMAFILIAIITFVVVMVMTKKSWDSSGSVGIFLSKKEKEAKINTALEELSPEQKLSLQTACAMPTSRTSVEKLYKIKCTDYGF